WITVKWPWSRRRRQQLPRPRHWRRARLAGWR
ncbi:MAG: hypothetical protein AVDCRST_MAG33-1739, partial [uncultured Thermomicrobiales bacterium]